MDDAVDFDGMQACFLGGKNAFYDLMDVAATGYFGVFKGVGCVEADVDAMESDGGEGLCEFEEEDGVGGEG